MPPIPWPFTLFAILALIMKAGLFKETKDFLKNYNITGDDICKNIYQTVINEPANYLQYYVGYLEITVLKEKVQKQLGTDFNLKDFHKKLSNNRTCRL